MRPRIKEVHQTARQGPFYVVRTALPHTFACNGNGNGKAKAKATICGGRPRRDVKCAVASKPLNEDFKAGFRPLTLGRCGLSMDQLRRKLGFHPLGWNADSELARMLSFWRWGDE